MSDNLVAKNGMQTGPKLNTDLRMKVLAMMARGENYDTILRILRDKYDVTITSGALSNLTKRHLDTIKEMELMILEAETAEAEQVRVKALRQLSRKLDKASQDETEIEELDRKWRDGEIKDMADYRRRKAGLLKLSVNELSKVSREMYSQTDKTKAPGQLPGTAGAGTPDPKWIEALMLAVQRGDTIALQQLIITPNA